VRPTDNAFAKSFNGRVRQECLNGHWFASIEEARAVLEGWREAYNTDRPHSALGLRSTAEFVAPNIRKQVAVNGRDVS
jgi:putative transposase